MALKVNLGKRGDERVLSIYWFIMFIIVAVAVVSGVARFYGAPMDVRLVEAELLADKVIDCVSAQGKLDGGFMALGEGQNMREYCHLNFEDTSMDAYKGAGQYYISVQIGEGTWEAGNVGAKYQVFCGHTGSLKNVPVCVNKKVVLLDEREGGQGFVAVDVVSVVAKVEQNNYG